MDLFDIITINDEIQLHVLRGQPSYYQIDIYYNNQYVDGYDYTDEPRTATQLLDDFMEDLELTYREDSAVKKQIIEWRNK